MSYMALYRKWRPDAFSEVKGQEHIVTTLKNQIKHERIGHAYLFCGTRGTGKTTIAKLMAKAVNCEHPVDGSPCNECESCKAIAAGSSMNVIEIDAASNNGVDNIRQINNAVRYSPQAGKYLVYIIDEVHMLSIGAFNALLKTLEEPPEYVIFILATTESHKIPITILSRCQRYDFKRISIETITDRLADLMEREQISATRDALAYVARAADGSMRDALSILDQCIAFHLGEELTYDKVLDTIGAVDVEVYIRLMQAIATQEITSAMDIIDEAIWQGKDLTQFTSEFTLFIRNVLMLKLSPGMRMDLTSENISKLKTLGTEFSEERLIDYINILQETLNKLSYATMKRIVLELGIIKLCMPQMRQGYEEIKSCVEQFEASLEQRISEAQITYVPNERLQKEAPMQEIARAPESTLQADVTVDKETVQRESDRVVSNLQARYKKADYDEIMTIVCMWDQIKRQAMKLTRSFMDQVSVVPGDTPGTLDLVIIRGKENSNLVAEYFEKPHNIEVLRRDLAELTERDIDIRIRKLTQREADDSKVADFDLSKIKFNNIEVKY
ncbi:MAG: DNA polymerase III subunit gamma/tau [Eubacteriales bacterium]|nr:DNA polymerase III subunit gamma/tau [Eubacteriales bacterium]